MTKHFYAMYDWTVTKSNPGAGFANSKKAVAFTSKAARDAFVADRYYDNSAKAITRREAVKMAEVLSERGDKGIMIHNSADAVVIYRARWI